MNVKASRGIDGARVEKMLEAVNVVTNKNTVPGDKSAITPGGIRMGTPALTTRGFVEQDMKDVAEFFHRGVDLALEIQSRVSGKNTVKTFRSCLGAHEDLSAVVALKTDVTTFAQNFPTIGFKEDEMKYI